jgi:glycosyltransferase involved in cell wall biosynthesis
MAADKKLWIAWENDGSIRSRVLAKAMNAEYYTFTRFEKSNRLFFLRYPLAMIQTFLAVAKEKPDIFVTPDPSVLLCFIAALIKPLFNYKLIIDEHTLYISPTGMKKVVMDFLGNYYFKRCDMVIVTNEPYKIRMKESVKNKEIFVLPDQIPNFDYPFKKIELKGKYNILFICTFSYDEPWEEVIRAATLLDENTYIYISGRNRVEQTDIPSNVVLTGFIPDEDYQNLLRSVDMLMVLTEKEECMVCGAYEAVAAEKPLILSDRKVLRAYFDGGTVFTENNRKDIADAIRSVIKNQSVLKRDIRTLKKKRMTEWKERWDTLLREIS